MNTSMIGCDVWSPAMPDGGRRDYDRDWLFHALNDLKDQMIGQHQRIRSDMNAGFGERQVALEVHRTKDKVDSVEERVLVIETSRRFEEAQAVKRSAWAGILAAAGLTGLMQVIKAVWHLGQ